jgi:hypothetical protein
LHLLALLKTCFSNIQLKAYFLSDKISSKGFKLVDIKKPAKFSISASEREIKERRRAGGGSYAKIWSGACGGGLGVAFVT